MSRRSVENADRAAHALRERKKRENEAVSVTGQMVEDAEEAAFGRERACVVAWLLSGCGTGDADAVASLGVLAAAIKRGDHCEWSRSVKGEFPGEEDPGPTRHAFVHHGPFRIPLELCVECGHVFSNEEHHDGSTKRAPKRKKR